MNYIVFDLEWNQSPGGKRWSNSRLPFEVIEIGAIKLNEEKENAEMALLEKMERWEYLEDLAAQIENQ